MVLLVGMQCELGSVFSMLCNGQNLCFRWLKLGGMNCVGVLVNNGSVCLG
jgi:hypothetical protein